MEVIENKDFAKIK